MLTLTEKIQNNRKIYKRNKNALYSAAKVDIKLHRSADSTSVTHKNRLTELSPVNNIKLALCIQNKLNI